MAFLKTMLVLACALLTSSAVREEAYENIRASKEPTVDEPGDLWDAIFADTEKMAPSDLRMLPKPQRQAISNMPDLHAEAINFAKLGGDAVAKHVLVIVDVQQDYCNDCVGLDTDRITATGYGMPLEGVGDAIAALIESQSFDGYVVTQDLLPYGMRCAEKKQGGVWKKVYPLEVCEKFDDPYEFNACLKMMCERNDGGDEHVTLLTKGFPGSDVLPAISTALHHKEAHIDFKIAKQADDWLGETATSEDDGSPAADKLVRSFCDGGDCSHVTLWVTGIQTTRCVLKGVLHAVGLGFKVNVPRASTSGGGQSPSDIQGWKDTLSAARAAGGNGIAWWDVVAGSGSISPGMEKTWQLMEAAGVNVL